MATAAKEKPAAAAEEIATAAEEIAPTNGHAAPPQPRLIGQELLAAVQELGAKSPRILAAATGHSVITKQGKIQAQVSSFQQALLEAQGFSFGKDRSTSRKGTDIASVNGRNFLVLSAHHLNIAWEAIESGQQFRVTDAGNGAILLSPVDDAGNPA